MGMQLHWFKGRMLIGGLAVLLLAGCGENYGIDQHGRKVTAESLEGQWLLINYWATWCAPCRAENGEFNHLDGQLKGQPVSVLFQGDGVWQLMSHQQGQALERKTLLAQLGALPLYDIEHLYADAASLRERGLQADALGLAVQALEADDIRALIAAHDHVLRF